MKNLFNTIVDFVKLHKKIVIISLASFVGVCLVVAGCLLIPWGAGSTHFLVNTVNELFIDTDELLRIGEKLAENGYRSRIDFKLDGEEANRTSDVSIQMEALGYGDGDDLKERMDYLIKVDENEHGGGIAYADGKLYIIGYDKDRKQFCLYMPLDNILEELEGSIFAPTSDSKFAMSEDVYNQIKSALKGDNDDATEELREFYNRLLPKIKDQIKQKTVIADKNTVAITLEEETLKKIIEITVDELKGDEKFKERLSLDDEALDIIKKQLNESVKGYTFELTYTVEKNMLRSAHFSVEHDKVNTIDNIEYDLQITTEKNKDALTLTIETTTGPSHNRVTDSASLEYVRTEEKGKTNTTLTFTSKPHEGEEEMFYFTLEHYTKDGDYRLEYYSSEDAEDPDMLMEGKAGFYKNRGGYFFSIDKYADEDVSLTDLISFYTKLDKAGKQLTMPEGENFFDITEDRLDAIIAGINFAGMDKSLWTALGKKIHLSEDGLPITNYTVALSDAEAIKALFENYRRYSENQNVKKIYYYDEACGVYILCTYTGRYLTKFYTFPGKLLDEYHEAKILNGTFIVHEYEITEEREATCTTEGDVTITCKICGMSYTKKTTSCLPHQYEVIDEVPADCYDRGYVTEKCSVCDHIQTQSIGSSLGHLKESVTISASENPGMLGDAIITGCERCGVLLSVNYGESIIWYFNENIVYPDLSTRHYILPDQLSEYINVSSLEVNLYNAGDLLISVRIPNGCEVIEDKSFSAAHSLQVIVIPSSVNEIKDGAFSSEPPSTIFYLGTEEEWAEVELNSYGEIWSDVRIVFLPDGIDDASIISRCVDDTGLPNILGEKKSLTKSIGAAELLAENNSSVSIIYDGKVTLVAYDVLTDTVSIAKDEGGSTTIILMSSDGLVKTMFEIDDEISIMDSDNGLLAMTSISLGIIYLYDIASGELSNFKFERFECYFDEMFVDGDRVLFIAQDKYSTEVDLYSFIPGEKCKKIGTGIIGHEEYFFIRDYHTFITTDHINSLIEFYNTRDGSKIESIRGFKIEKNLLFAYGYMYVHHNYGTNSSGSEYSYIDLNSNQTAIRPDSFWCDFDIGDCFIEVQPIFASSNGKAAMILDADGNVSIAFASADSDATVTVDYYAEKGFITNDGDVILYTPGGYGIIIVDI